MVGGKHNKEIMFLYLCVFLTAIVVPKINVFIIA